VATPVTDPAGRHHSHPPIAALPAGQEGETTMPNRIRAVMPGRWGSQVLVRLAVPAEAGTLLVFAQRRERVGDVA
jgi:hypothetical protein